MRFITYILVTCLLGACGEVSYKHGGSAQDIERSHQACRGSGDQLAVCLEKLGWAKPQVDAFDPLFATVSVTDNQHSTGSKPAMSPVTPEANKANDAPVSVAKITKAQQTASAPSTKTVQPPSTVNDGPDVSYAINSWWKMGAFPQQLTTDQTQCEKKLGPAYLPDYKTQTYKRAFIVCMHDLGWMAVRNIK